MDRHRLQVWDQNRLFIMSSCELSKQFVGIDDIGPEIDVSLNKCKRISAYR